MRLALVLVLLATVASAQNAAQLEQRSKAFYEMLERGQRDRAAETWPGLERDLATATTELENRLDAMRDEVAERDGSMEELYLNPKFREPEIQSLVIGYHLAWVRYQAAQLVTDAPKKKGLLQKAVDGFSQFTMMSEVPEVYAESIYGRGLAYMDLGEKAKAQEDFEQAAKESRTATKAKAALEELKRRGAGGQAPPPKAEPAPDDPEVLLGKLGTELPKAAEDPGRQQDTTALARGLAARGGTWPTRVATTVAEALGDGTPTGARSTYGLALQAQLAIDRGKCADVPALAAASENLKDAGRARQRPELLFLAGGCQLNGGKAADAATTFATLLQEFPDSPRAREAAYYRFRALDVARGQAPGLDVAFTEALRTYLAKYGKTDGAAEARWLLGDFARAKGDCATAATELAQVPAGPYAARAKMGALECRVTALSSKTSPDDRKALATDLRAFVESTPAKGSDAPLVARAALMGALVAAGTTPPSHDVTLVLLDGFEEKYPDAKDLVPRVVEARLEAHVATGQLEPAKRDLEAYVAGGTDGERRKTLSRLGRDLAGKAERGEPAEKAQAMALARTVYAALVAKDPTTADRIMLADLEMRGGDPAAARKAYDEILATTPDSAEALRGAAKAATTTGDTNGALAYWRRVVEASPPGGTAWYEARVAQVTILAADGRKPQACEILRSSRGRATSTGGDALAASLKAMEPEVCK